MTLATETDACREFARNVGRERPEQAWILTPYDTWEKNPFYAGPPVRHPEDDCEEEDAVIAANQRALAALASPIEMDEIPF